MSPTDSVPTDSEMQLVLALGRTVGALEGVCDLIDEPGMLADREQVKVLTTVLRDLALEGRREIVAVTGQALSPPTWTREGV